MPRRETLELVAKGGDSASLMRKLVLSMAPVALALVALMACEDDPSLGGPDLALDSGSGGFDAANPGFDGAVPTTDAAPDADVPPAVSVTVATPTGFEAGVLVVFNAADGSVIETKQTGADGKATHAGSDAAFVTALLVHDGTHRLVTWTGVEVGDDLELLDPDALTEPTTLGTYDVTLSTFEDAGAIGYFLRSPCNSTQADGTTGSLELYSNCAKAKNSVLGKAKDEGGYDVGFAFTKGIAAPSGGNGTAVTLGAWSGPQTFDLQVGNLPVETLVDGNLAQIADGTGFFVDYEDRLEQNGSNVPFNVAKGFADAYQASIRRYGEYGQRTIMKHVPGSATAIAFDYEAFLPEMTDVSIDSTNARRPVLTWTASSSLATTDGGVLRFRFDRPNEEAYFSWTVVVAPGATSVTIPALPPEAEAFAPPDGGTDQEPDYYALEAAFLEADVIPNYASFRRFEGAVPGIVDSSFGEFAFPIVPVDGTYRATGWGLIPRLQKPRPRPVPVTE